MSATNILGLDDFSIFAVFDGHGIILVLKLGQNGHLASQAIKNFILDYFSNANLYSTSSKGTIDEEFIYEKLKENNYERLKNSFIKAEKYLMGLKFDVNFSGSTGVMFILLGKLLLFNLKEIKF